jgi:hypothetical protein
MKKNTDGLIALYQGVCQNLTMIHSADDAIESKLNTLLAADLLVITLVVSNVKKWQLFIFVGLALLALSVLLATIGIWSRNYHSATVKVADNMDYTEMDSRELILQLISDAEKSYDESFTITTKKASLFNPVIALFLLGSIVSLLTLAVN